MLVDGINTWARKVPTWAVYIVYLLPVPILLYQAQTGGLGREPITALEHELGEIALQLLIIGLCISPLRRFTGVNLIRFRRAMGLLAFTYVALHLLVWVVLDMSLLWGQMWADIWKRPHITIGVAAFVLMIPLAVTSNNMSLRRMGAASWRRLHLLTYPIAVMAALHYIWLARGFQLEPFAYMSVIIVLLALRYVPRFGQAKRT